MTEAEKLIQKMPSILPFEIPMVADSTTYATVDIPTKLGAKEAWHIIGVDWCFENINPATIASAVPAVGLTRQFQIHRNNTHAGFLSLGDEDLVFSDKQEWRQLTGVGTVYIEEGVQKHLFQTITLSPVLRALFQTNVDDASISVAGTIILKGVLYYHIISAPDDGRTKLGIPLDEI